MGGLRIFYRACGHFVLYYGDLRLTRAESADAAVMSRHRGAAMARLELRMTGRMRSPISAHARRR